MSYVLDVLHTLQAFLNPDRVIAILTLLVASLAAWLAYLSPSRRDMKRVEDSLKRAEDSVERVEDYAKRVEAYVAETSQHLHRQSRREELSAKASRVSIAIRGMNTVEEPLLATIVVRDPTVRPTHVDLSNDAGAVYGSSRITQVDAETYNASIDPGVLMRLSQSQVGVQSMRACVHMVIEKEEVHREMPVTLANVSMQTDPQNPHLNRAGWIIQGEV